MAAEVALQMRPADLPRAGVQVLVSGPAVGDDDPWIRADQRVELLTVAVLGDPEQRGLGGGQRPQGAAVSGGSPSGLIDVQRRLIEHPVVQLCVRTGECGASALADRI